MSTTNQKVIQQKEKLAEQTLQVAEDSLELLRQSLDDCSARDLVSIFNSAVKAHRELVSDIIAISDQESKEEQNLAKDYDAKVTKLLKKINPGE